ncbi:DNA invertase Pin-like site-specific DNA recombinase [Clostridium acetobutylicum]|uniref:Site-specific recombinase, DNA invertase Pin homolog n=3 Tax=Clostridium acetobutylicum TaxID=1488 RepID=Q97GW8_CLOAB|nr:MULTISPECIES: recombinase family protein [Clostridium]AAK80204.1 Site-specific recombinase, DNA invertase Pin homolog [Clostridium acetobutylicum ATCC 824]ADZ21298.1 Site-specific recombinase [Clostridium acetobutylicum EA 2018]AEI34711.1 site-specific recombinase, DNA invertase Pin-like protein [Clostridium acetobutylicum DSM 1731]AWV79371.1 DNA invertase Pin [Clostridium acetobutylicum]MBC2394658.1 recombinase family protein [Clostridium acetobutylicum]
MNVVGYVRLSRDEDKENYSSIITQKNIIEEYSKNKNWTVNRIYVDDNCSGYTFERPEFLKMMYEIKERKIDVIVAKDLSRIGRNNGKVLVFIDKLKEKGIRLILVEEATGGLDLLEDNYDILGIKTWYNEMYVKDISRKIRASMHLKQKKGKLIIGNIYGYKKIKVEDEVTLIVDEEIRPIIQLIFKYYIKGFGYKKICDLLNGNGYSTPSECMQKKHANNGRVFKNNVAHRWQAYMINRIIKNDIYIGILRTKKRQVKMIKGKEEKVPKEEQYVFENHHEAIITKEEFALAQEINLRRNRIKFSGKAKYNYIFRGFMQCGECGYAVVGCNLKAYPKIERGYNCRMYRRYGNKICSNHSVSEHEVLFFFKEFLRDIRRKYKEYILKINIDKKEDFMRSSLSKMQKQLYIEKEELRFILCKKIKDISREDNKQYKKIIEEAYVRMEKEKKKNILKLTQEIEKFNVENNLKCDNSLKNALQVFDNIIESENLKREDVERVLDKIIVYKNKHLEFRLKVNIDSIIK